MNTDRPINPYAVCYAEEIIPPAVGSQPPLPADAEVPEVELQALVIGDLEYIQQRLIDSCNPVQRYLRQGLERARIREHMKTALSMDVPTSRAFSSEYYLDDPYLDVRLGTLDGWCFGRFIHDPLWNDVETGLPVGDTLIVGWTDPTPFLPRRIRCSSAMMRALLRVVNEP